MDGNHPDKVDPRPKRRKMKDNPYEIFTTGIETATPHYFLSFLDGNGAKRCIEVSKAVFDTFDRFELDGKRCGFSKRYFLVLVACRHLTCTKTECRKMFLSLIAPLTTIRLNRGKRSNRLPYIFAQGQER